jgi:hypothetical protein
LNKLINGSILSLILIVSLFTLLISSCESLRKDPDYMGTWQFTKKITANNLVYNTTRTLKLTKNTYEETYVIQRENPGTISAIIGTSGSLELTHKNLVFILEEIGTCALNESEACTGDVQWYAEGTQYWQDNIPYFEKKVTGEYEVNETTLRLTRDLNNDGDIEDTGEDVTFEML